MLCRYCQKEIPYTANFCRYCGEKVEDDYYAPLADEDYSVDNYHYDTPKNKNSELKTAVIAIVILVVPLLLLVLIPIIIDNAEQTYTEPSITTTGNFWDSYQTQSPNNYNYDYYYTDPAAAAPQTEGFLDSLFGALSPQNAAAPTSEWIITPYNSFEKIIWCADHQSFVDSSSEKFVREDLVGYDGHYGHGIPWSTVIYFPYDNYWEVASLDGYKYWGGNNLREYFGDYNPYNGSYTTNDGNGHFNGYGVIHNNKISLKANAKYLQTDWVGFASAYKDEDSWHVLYNGENREYEDIKLSWNSKYDDDTKYIAVYDGNGWGAITCIDGQKDIPCVYEDLVIIDNTRAFAKKYGKYGVISLQY
jgi:hypothetical protein